MGWRSIFVPNAVAFLCVVAFSSGAAAAEGAGAASVSVADATAAAEPVKDTSVKGISAGKGFLYYPSAPPMGKFRFGLGGQYDAVDPAVMYGMNVRLPQLTADARFGLSNGWSLKGRFNSMYVTTELLIGGAYAHRFGNWSLEAAASIGVYYGQLAEFGFDANMIAPEWRPELTLGWDLTNDTAISLRGSLLLMGPERVRVGEVWGGLDNSNLFVGHSEMIFVENTTSKGSVWYFGLGAMTTRAYYQMWLLFPDAPGLYTYARAAAGYEF